MLIVFSPYSTGYAESTGTGTIKGVSLNRGMPHPPNFEGCIVKVFFIYFQNFEFVSSIKIHLSQKTVQKMCSKKWALAHTVYLGITKYFLINNCSLSFKMVYLM